MDIFCFKWASHINIDLVAPFLLQRHWRMTPRALLVCFWLLPWFRWRMLGDKWRNRRQWWPGRVNGREGCGDNHGLCEVSLVQERGRSSVLLPTFVVMGPELMWSFLLLFFFFFSCLALWYYRSNPATLFLNSFHNTQSHILWTINVPYLTIFSLSVPKFETSGVLLLK